MQSIVAISEILRPMSVAASAALDVDIDPAVHEALLKGAVCAISVSGGKDSQAAALATVRYLDRIGHTGTRVLVHADLGIVEWKDSLPACRRLAEHLGLELIVKARAAGGLMERWEGRWRNNLARYADLSCVKVILPWSTPAMRFCTSELKTQVLSAELKRRFPRQNIVNVTGVRCDESAARRKTPVSSPATRLTGRYSTGITWNPIRLWSTRQVFDYIAAAGVALHEAYRVYHASRVSCIFCIMSSEADLMASAACHDNHDAYRRMVALEAASGFAFQGNRWLGDVAPQLLDAELLAKLEAAKAIAKARGAIESEIPEHLLYTSGWPTVMPTPEEAELLASVRRRIAQLMGINVKCMTADEVTARYAELMAAKPKGKAKVAEAEVLA